MSPCYCRDPKCPLNDTAAFPAVRKGLEIHMEIQILLAAEQGFH